MVKSVPRRLGHIIWPAMVTMLVLLAIYVSGGRLLMGALPGFQDEIERALSQRVPGEVSVAGMVGSMEGFSPTVSFSQFSIRVDGYEEGWIHLNAARIRLDPWQSLLSRALRFDELTLMEPTIKWQIGRQRGPFRLPDNVRDLLNTFDSVQIRNATLINEVEESDKTVSLAPLRVHIDMVRERSRRTVNVSVEAPEGQLLTAQGFGIGDPLLFDRFYGELYGQLTGLGLSYLGPLLGHSVTADGTANFWWQASGGVPSGVIQGAFENLTVADNDSFYLKKLHFEAAIDGTADATQLFIQNGQLASEEIQAEIPRLQVTQGAEGWELRTQQFEVAPLMTILVASQILPESTNTMLIGLNPTGRVEGLSLAIDALTDPFSAWAVEAEVIDVAMRPFRKAPGLVGIDATIAATDQGAQAWIRATDFQIELPRVYSAPIVLPSVTGTLAGRWRRDALFLEQGLFLAEAPGHAAKVQFAIDIPLSKVSSSPLDMRFSAAVTDAPIAIRDAYVPYRLPERSYKWLKTAPTAGHIDEAIFLWHGGFRPYGDDGQTMQLAAELSDVSLDYQLGWPPAQITSGQLRIDDTQIAVWSPGTTVAGTTLERAAVNIALARGTTPLTIQAVSRNNALDIQQTLAQLPALAFAGPIVNDLQIAGDADTELRIAFDLKKPSDTLDVSVGVTLDNARIGSNLLALQADKVTGQIGYQTTTGFYGTDLSATLFGRPVSVDIGPHLTNRTDTVLAATFQFEAAVADISAWRPISVAIPAEGVAPVTVTVTVADAVAVDIRSDLEGVAIDLPLPWGKAVESRAPLHVQWSNRASPVWRAFWFGRLSAVADFSLPDAAVATIDVTPRTRPAANPLALPDSGLLLIGFLPSLDISEWSSLGLSPTTPSLGESVPVSVHALRVGQLRWRGEELGELLLGATVEGARVDAQFSLPWLSAAFQQKVLLPQGSAEAPLDGSLTRQLSIDALDLDGLPDMADQWVDAVPPTPDKVSPHWTPLVVKVNEIYRTHNSLGDIAFVVDYDQSVGWEFRDITGDFLGVEWLPSTRIGWRIAPDGQQTSLSLAAELSDISESLALIGVAPLVETRGGNLKADWRWQGGPADFSAASISGVMDLQMASGSFTSANAEAEGALRLLSLLNLSGLLRRANINQLFDPGVTFDQAKGRFEFSEGLLTIPAFSIEGSGGYFSFSSDIDLISETVDGELVVTLPLVENIPWVAALAGGLPIAAGTYLVSKVFEEQVNRLSSGVYSVSGDLESPEVIFERVFDASSRANDAQD